MEKRTDRKGRVLQKGESQRKDGLYVYKYMENKKPKFLYSWKLVATDKLPKGKRPCVALREQIKEVKKDIEDGISTTGKKMTLCELYAKQNASRANVRKDTVKNRKRLMTALEQDMLGSRSIDSIKPSDAKEWAVRMKEKGYAYNTINNFKRSLKASYYIAIEDDCARKNPFNFNLKDVIENDTKAKEALTKEQQKALLDFAQKDCVYKKYYQAIVILLHTGLRISELCGLTVADIDFNNRSIDINHQLKKDKDGYYTEPPKTDSGYRKVYMTDTVYQALKEILKSRSHAQPINVDGHSNFLFLNRDGYPMYNALYLQAFTNLVKKHNKYHKGNELPHITPHILRHTFCTNMANRGMTPNNLQYVMGHKNITITLGYYAHGSFQSAQEEMQRLVA